MTAPIAVLRGDPVVLVVILTKDDAPWTDVADYTPQAQVRRAPDLEVVATWDLTFASNVMTMTLRTSNLREGPYVTDVEFTDPNELDPELAVFTWPGPGQERLTLEVSNDVTVDPGS